MSADRNKTELTQNITRNVALWLDGKGFKPVETEVGVDRGWFADVAGVGCLTQTEMIDMKLIKRAPRWKHGLADNSPQQAALDAWRASLAAVPFPLTVTVEVKTSVGDYRGDRKWTADWPTNLCYVAMPEGMINAVHWPDSWGVILFSQEGTSIRKVFPSVVKKIPTEQQLSVILALAVARDHVTRHARIRELQKQIRFEDGQRKTVERFSHAIRAVRLIMKGKPIEDVLNSGTIRSLPADVMDDLKSLVPAPVA